MGLRKATIFQPRRTDNDKQQISKWLNGTPQEMWRTIRVIPLRFNALLYLSVAYIFFDITELDRGNTWIEFLTIGICGLIGTITTFIILFFYHNLF